MLFIQWAVIGTLGVTLVTAQTIAGKFGDDGELAWNWLLGQFTPALSILLAAAFSDPSRRWREAAASGWKWKAAFVLGLLQAGLMFAMLLIEPLLSLSPFELFAKTQWLLSLLQGIVVAALGATIFDGR